MPENVADSDFTQFGTLRTADAIPDVLDVFIAGGGPGGTAAAARAREIGLGFLVVDYDDLLKRIRDYPKEKPIKPNYGGGDKMPFPPGGPLVTALHFDEIDKDEMVAQWKRKYAEFRLNARVGSEFTGLNRRSDGIWDVKTWNHRSQQEVVYRARNVIIAIGAGVPRRFDIPGNSDGLAFRLDDPRSYVGEPCLVIGGGTSAAEAVIAISKAKVAAEDPSSVYWSYRGDKLPKVSKALSDEFFDAYVGNGNIKYMPFSEPTAVVTGPDKIDYVSLRVDRKVIQGRPIETTHLEFPKKRVVACIGEDPPIKLLQQLGTLVPAVKGRQLMLVNEHGEVSLPGVFLIGDARGPKYVQCKSFEDPSTYQEVTQKRNIKLAMWDAVQAVELIATRLAKPQAGMAAAVAPRTEERSPNLVEVVPPKPLEAASAQQPTTAAQLVALLSDGTPEEQFPISKDQVSIGRTATDIACPEDVYMSDLHALLTRSGDAYMLEDRGSSSGVWLRVRDPNGVLLAQNDVLWIGSQLFIVDRTGVQWALRHLDAEGLYQSSHPLPEKGVILGRTAEYAPAPGDRSISKRHAQFLPENGSVRVFDLGSTNGTYLKLGAPRPLANGDEFRLASKKFRFELFERVAKVAVSDLIVEQPRPAAPPPSAAAPGKAPAAAPSVAVPAGSHPVVLEHAQHPAAFAVSPGVDLLHGFFEYIKQRHPGDKVDDHAGEPLDWSCKTGSCGLCAVEIVEGCENFIPPEPASPEMKTIERVAALDPDPNKYRLTCVARIKGPVKLKMPE